MIAYISINEKKYQDKKLIYVLKTFYGLNLSLSKKICKSLGYDINIKIKNCRSQDLTKISSIINLEYKFIHTDQLKKYTYDKIQTMKHIRSYKGIRHSYSLPVNGQRTHTNAKTRRWR